MKKKTLTPSIEDYLEAIYDLDKNDLGVRSVDVANYLSVSKPSVHKALQNLIASNLATQEKYSAIHLTELGKKKAREVLFRHETIKEFLITILGVNNEKANDEACMIEHAMSTDTVEKMQLFLRKNAKAKKNHKA